MASEQLHREEALIILSLARPGVNNARAQKVAYIFSSTLSCSSEFHQVIMDYALQKESVLCLFFKPMPEDFKIPVEHNTLFLKDQPTGSSQAAL